LAIRTHHVVYVEAGFVDGSAKSDGQAEYASCDDLSDHPQGAYFPTDAHEVAVWSFVGHDSMVVLGVRESGDRFRVFVAEGQDASKVLRTVRHSLQNKAR
jgi:hypothetical protein